MSFFPSPLGVGLGGAAAAPSWTPEDLFGSGEYGDWIDYTDTAKLNQAIAGTGSAVSSAGDRIGYAAGVNGNVAVALADDNTRPTFISGGGALFANGESRRHRVTLANAISGASDVWGAAVFSMPSGDGSATNRVLSLTSAADGSSDTTASGGMVLLLSRGDSTSLASYQSNAWRQEIAYGFSGTRTAFYSAWDQSASEHILTRDGTDDPTVAYAPTGAMTGGYLQIGGIPTRYSSASIYEWILLNRIPGGAEIAELETYWNTKYGITFA